MIKCLIIGLFLWFQHLFAKIYEKVLHFKNKTNIFSENQFGLREVLTTEDAVLNYASSVIDGIDQGVTVSSLWTLCGRLSTEKN